MSQSLTSEQLAIIKETLDDDAKVCGISARAGSG